MTALDDDDARAAIELQDVLGRLFRRLRAERDLPLAQGAVLSWLAREGPVTVSDLAARERVRPQSMTPIVSAMEGLGLVSRRPDPDDGRRILVELTAAGLERFEVARRHRQSWLARAIAEQLTPSERATLADATALLRRLTET